MAAEKRGREKFGNGDKEHQNGNLLSSVNFMEDAVEASVTPKENVDTSLIQQTNPVGERVEPAKRSVGRQPKERKIKRTYPKTIYFDEPTSMKLSDVRTKDKIEIKDLVLVATIEFLKRNFNEEERCLSEASKDYIRKEMDKILEVFSE